MRYLLITIFLFSISINSFSQKKPKKNATDSVRVKGRSFLILGDSSIYIERDTVLVLPDSIAVKLKRDETKRSDDFYKNMRDKFYKRRVTKELYDLLFVDPPDNSIKPKPPTVQVSNGNYEKFEGRKVKNIRIKKLEVFGTSIRDTTRHTESWAINLANDIHTYTRSRIIKNNIFFEEGDMIDPDRLTDSERVLRGLPYVKDARIYLISKGGEDDVDVLILVKDVWSISGEFNYSSPSRFDVALIDKNFLGLGQELKNEFLYDTDNDPKVGYSGTYTINNIYKTFVGAELYYASSEPLDRVGGRLYRDFITPETKYAGALTILKEKRQLLRAFPDTTIAFFAQYNLQDAWLGRSFLIKEMEDGGRVNVQLAGRFARRKHLERPTVAVDTNYQFFDSHTYLFSVGLTKRAYEKSSLITGFGRTEDIPKGYLAEFTFGKENGEFYDRTYLGWRFAYGQYFKRVGYLKPTLSLGGFLREGRIEQSVVKLDVQYFSFLYRLNKLNFRQFFRLSYSLGIRRFENEFVNINDQNGVRGLEYTFLRGTRKLSFSAETIAFTPLYFLGFRFAPFFFVDLGVVNSESTKLLKNTLYQGYGLGLRLRNENLAFNTIQIRFAWYPVTPPENSNFGFNVDGRNPLGIRDFQTEIPSKINFE